MQRIRRRLREPAALPDVEAEDPQGDVHAETVARANARRLWGEIASLPRQQRQALLLREFGGLSYEDVAAALGVSVPAVESLLFRARARLRRRLEAAITSLNLAGGASTASDLLARLLGSGAGRTTPVAAKAVVGTLGLALLGGGGAIVGDQLGAHGSAPGPQAVRAAPPPTVRAPVQVPLRSRIFWLGPAKPVRAAAWTEHETEHESEHETGARPSAERAAPQGSDRADGAGSSDRGSGSDGSGSDGSGSDGSGSDG